MFLTPHLLLFFTAFLICSFFARNFVHKCAVFLNIFAYFCTFLTIFLQIAIIFKSLLIFSHLCVVIFQHYLFFRAIFQTLCNSVPNANSQVPARYTYKILVSIWKHMPSLFLASPTCDGKRERTTFLLFNFLKNNLADKCIVFLQYSQITGLRCSKFQRYSMT